MKELILILLISYILSLSTTYEQIFQLPIYGSHSYSGNIPSLTFLNISEFKEDKIIISYYIKHFKFLTNEIKYGFTDNYPDINFQCKYRKNYSYTTSTTNGGTKKNKKITSIDYYYEIVNQNKTFLVLENLLYPDYEIEVTHHKEGEFLKKIIILLVVFFAVCFFILGLVLFLIFKDTKKKKKSESIDFQKGEPSPLCPPNEPYDSTQANIFPIQQPPYIPPDASIPNEVGYSSGTGEKAYYS